MPEENGRQPNRAERRAMRKAGAPPEEPVKAGSLPPEIMAALTAQADPYSLYGQAMARVVQLENVVNVMIGYLTRLVEEASAPDPETAGVVIEHATKEMEKPKPE